MQESMFATPEHKADREIVLEESVGVAPEHKADREIVLEASEVATPEYRNVVRRFDQATHRDEAVGRVWSIGECDSRGQIFLDRPQLEARLAVLNSRGILFSEGVLVDYSSGVATRWLGER